MTPHLQAPGQQDCLHNIGFGVFPSPCALTLRTVDGHVQEGTATPTPSPSGTWTTRPTTWWPEMMAQTC